MSGYRDATGGESLPPVVYRPMRPAVVAAQVISGTVMMLVCIGWIAARLHHVHLHCESSGGPASCVLTEDYLVTTTQRTLSRGDIQGTTVIVHKPVVGELYEYSVAIVVGDERVAIGRRERLRSRADEAQAALKAVLASTSPGAAIDLDRGRERPFVAGFIAIALLFVVVGTARELQRVEIRLDARGESLRIVHDRWPRGEQVDDVPLDDIVAFRIVERRGGLVTGRFITIERKTGPDVDLLPRVGRGSHAYHEEIVRALESLRRRGSASA